MAKAPAAAKSEKPKAKPKAAKSADSTAPKTGGIHAPVPVSKDLAAIIGEGPMPRSEVTSKIWDYVKKNKLQKESDKRTIVADEKLKKIFGKDECSMFEMTKFVSAHLK